jgi:hypothetical protein
LITLVGGLASTVFIPVAQLAVDHLGWQQALIALAALWSATGELRMVFAGVLVFVVIGVCGLWLASGAQRRHAIGTKSAHAADVSIKAA